MKRCFVFTCCVIILNISIYIDAFAACSGSSPNLIALSPNRNDVADCVEAANDGDQISIPAGSALWTSGLAMTKFIRIVGAGAGNTIIKANWGPVTEKISNSAYIISWNINNASLNLPFGVSSITFNLDNKTCGFWVKNNNKDPITKFRVSNNAFSNAIYLNGERTWYIEGNVYGVIDQNIFGSGGPIYGLNSNWENMAFEFGTENQLYIEDNLFNSINAGIAGGGVGGRYCARYNTIKRSSSALMLQAFEYHGNQPGANNAGMGMELYGNKIINIGSSSLSIQLFDHRGGQSVAHHNYIDIGVGGSVWATTREEYVDNINAAEPPVGPTGQPQHVYWSYYWLNQKNGAAINPYASQTVTYPASGTGLIPSDLGRTIPQIDKDFWIGVSSFDGSKGIGCGTIDKRPNTCTPGVAFWATEQSCSDIDGMVGVNPTTPISGTLYKCTAPNTWTEYYKPYTYPHPLRGVAGQSNNEEIPAPYLRRAE